MHVFASCLLLLLPLHLLHLAVVGAFLWRAGSVLSCVYTTGVIQTHSWSKTPQVYIMITMSPEKTWKQCGLCITCIYSSLVSVPQLYGSIVLETVTWISIFMDQMLFRRLWGMTSSWWHGLIKTRSKCVFWFLRFLRDQLIRKGKRGAEKRQFGWKRMQKYI